MAKARVHINEQGNQFIRDQLVTRMRFDIVKNPDLTRKRKDDKTISGQYLEALYKLNDQIIDNLGEKVQAVLQTEAVAALLDLKKVVSEGVPTAASAYTKNFAAFSPKYRKKKIYADKVRGARPTADKFWTKEGPKGFLWVRGVNKKTGESNKRRKKVAKPLAPAITSFVQTYGSKMVAESKASLHSAKFVYNRHRFRYSIEVSLPAPHMGGAFLMHAIHDSFLKGKAITSSKSEAQSTFQEDTAWMKIAWLESGTPDAAGRPIMANTMAKGGQAMHRKVLHVLTLAERRAKVSDLVGLFKN